MTTPSVAELEQQAELLKDRVRHVALEVKALFAEDLPRFVERELKRAFVSHPEFAATIGDDTLRGLKRDIIAEGQRATDAVLAALEDEALWFPESPGEEDPRKSLAENRGLWDVVSGITGAVTEIMTRYGFPQSGSPPEYKPPTWFIGRRYLPSLSEKYWRHVRDLAKTLAQIRDIRTEHSQSELARRWDDTSVE